MKVCLLSYNHKPYIGGIETYSNELQKFMLSKNIKHKIICGKFVKFKFIRIIEVILRFYLNIVSKNYDIVHLTSLNLWPVLFINKLSNKHLIFIVNLHGLELMYGERKKLLSRLYNFLLPINYINNQDNIHFLCNSIQTMELAEKKFFKNKLHFIPMGVKKVLDTDTTKNINKNHLFYIGRIVERKGVSWFCDNVLIHFKDTKLFFAGPIIDKDEFNKINSNPQTQYMGIISEEHKLMMIQQSLATVIPNITNLSSADFEGFGISLLEIVALGGLPIAAKSQGIITSSLDGKIGITVREESPDEWKEQIKILQTSKLELRSTLIAENQILVRKNFLWNDIFKLTIEHYMKLLEKSEN
jgi:glycosyltransferase involved in cell wall biosynthesis